MSHRPFVLRVGDLTVVMPTEGQRLTRSMLDDLACASVLDADGREGPARELIAQLEQRLGVHPAHREALAKTPEGFHARLREEKMRRRLDEHRRVAQMSAPLRDPAIVEAIAAKEHQAHDKRAEAASLRIIGPKIHRKAAKALESQARALDEQAAELKAKEAEQDRLYGEAKDPILRAKMRGEEIAAADVEMAEILTDEYGARIIQRRGPGRGLPAMKYTRGTRAKKFTGIEHAYLSGHLKGGPGSPSAESLRNFGLSWGEAFVIVCGQAGKGEGGGGGGFGPKAPQPRMVEAGEARSIMAGTIARPGLDLVRMTQREVDVLDNICGRDMILRDLAPTRGMVPALQRRLRRALRIAMANMKAAQERGEVGKAARQVMVAVEELAKVR
jgi:hypothetical protein